jgi:hypothetical protein
LTPICPLPPLLHHHENHKLPLAQAAAALEVLGARPVPDTRPVNPTESDVAEPLHVPLGRGALNLNPSGGALESGADPSGGEADSAHGRRGGHGHQNRGERRASPRDTATSSVAAASTAASRAPRPASAAAATPAPGLAAVASAAAPRAAPRPLSAGLGFRPQAAAVLDAGRRRRVSDGVGGGSVGCGRKAAPDARAEDAEALRASLPYPISLAVARAFAPAAAAADAAAVAAESPPGRPPQFGKER